MIDNNAANQAKNYFWVILDVLLGGIFLCGLLFGVPALKHYGDSMVSPRIITVSAEGKTTVSPDIATTSFSIISRGMNPETLAADNNGKIGNVVDFLKSQGVDAKDIKTIGYNLSPDYAYNQASGKSTITGYTLTQTVTVKIRALDNVAKILGGLTPLGINQIGGVNFSIDDDEKYLVIARNDAFSKAHAKAVAMAEANGVTIGRVLNIQESQGGGPMPYYAKSMAAGLGGAPEAVPAPTIEPGSQDVTISVTVTYELQ
jgi:uncharacterized protein YggE